MFVRRTVLILIAVLVGCCVACQPPIPPVIPPQTEGTIHLEGDSVTFNVYYDGGVAPFFTTGEFVPGSSIDASWSGEAANTRVPRMVSEGKVDTLVWALGLNEIYLDPNHQWSSKYQWEWYDLLVDKVPSESCIVMVKPWVLPIGNTTRPLSSMNALRKWIDDFAAAHPNVVTVDWKPILEANPGFSSVDGVHIEKGTGGAEARDVMYREGVSRCAA